MSKRFGGNISIGKCDLMTLGDAVNFQHGQQYGTLPSSFQDLFQSDYDEAGAALEAGHQGHGPGSFWKFTK